MLTAVSDDCSIVSFPETWQGRCAKPTCSIYALKPNIWKYLKCYVLAYMLPSVVIFLTLFVLVFLRAPFSCKSASETVGLLLLQYSVWMPSKMAPTLEAATQYLGGGVGTCFEISFL